VIFVDVITRDLRGPTSKRIVVEVGNEVEFHDAQPNSVFCRLRMKGAHHLELEFIDSRLREAISHASPTPE
jgi:hypothetical protein